MRYSYVKPDFSFLELEMESAVLDGSYTNKAIKVATVEVEDYAPGFVDGSGNEIPFQDITFD